MRKKLVGRKKRVEFRGSIEPKWAILRRKLEGKLGREVANYPQAIRRGLTIMAEENGVEL